MAILILIWALQSMLVATIAILDLRHKNSTLAIGHVVVAIMIYATNAPQSD